MNDRGESKPSYLRARTTAIDANRHETPAGKN